MRERIFRSVVFPAPFLPTRPNTSPCGISRLTSFNAHRYSVDRDPAFFRNGRAKAPARMSRKARYLWNSSSLYRLPRFSARITVWFIGSVASQTEHAGLQSFLSHGETAIA